MDAQISPQTIPAKHLMSLLYRAGSCKIMSFRFHFAGNVIVFMLPDKKSTRILVKVYL